MAQLEAFLVTWHTTIKHTMRWDHKPIIQVMAQVPHLATSQDSMGSSALGYFMVVVKHKFLSFASQDFNQANSYTIMWVTFIIKNNLNYNIIISIFEFQNLNINIFSF